MEQWKKMLKKEKFVSYVWNQNLDFLIVAWNVSYVQDKSVQSVLLRYVFFLPFIFM